jgi:hypothetical protein
MLARVSPEAKERDSLEWINPCLEGRALLNDDPAGESVQSFAGRWMDLAKRTTGGDLAIGAGSLRAWADRQNWPPAIQREVASFKLNEIGRLMAKASTSWYRKYYGQEEWNRFTEFYAPLDAASAFIGKVLERPLRKYFSEDAWARRVAFHQRKTPEEFKETIHNRVRLLRDIQAALGEAPGREAAQLPATRWQELRRAEAGHDPRRTSGIFPRMVRPPKLAYGPSL